MIHYILSNAALARVSYHGRLPFAAPLACDVQRDGRRTFSVAQYAELVERVRAHLGDDTDYSQE